MCTFDDDVVTDGRSEILELLDDRSRLCEDPERRAELHLTYERLRKRLRRFEPDDKRR
jgi:hypothetical protein